MLSASTHAKAEVAMGKELSERKKKILHALVDVYITTGQPVSSSDIQRGYMPEVSSATIRAELSALEALGYVDQPHTSAGRVPLKPAYQLYVGDIEHLGDKALTDAETAFIRSRFADKLSEVRDISKRAAEIISDVTNYTSFFVSSRGGNILIDEIKLIPLKGDKLLVLIVTDEGIIADKTLDFEGGVRHEYVDSATRMLNNVFAGRKIGELESMDLDKELNAETDGFRDIFGRNTATTWWWKARSKCWTIPSTTTWRTPKTSLRSSPITTACPNCLQTPRTA